MSSSLKVVNIALVFWASWLSFLSCMMADMSSSLKVVNIALVFWASFSLLAIFILITGAAPAAGALGGIGGGGGLAASGAAGLGGGGGGEVVVEVGQQLLEQERLEQELLLAWHL